MSRPAVHLVTYATPRFRHRQWFLGASALANEAADHVHAWSPSKVAEAGFSDCAPGIRLDERGSGFWAWKPFIIHHAFTRAKPGDLVFYCDVGRRYPFKQLKFFPGALVGWMASQGQDVLPGLEIPWKGPMCQWTKRDAFIATGMDLPEVHRAIPIQASFSLWRVGPAAKELLEYWLEWSLRRDLISDDPGICGVPELPEFHDHRHDQSLLTLACLKCGIKGVDIGKRLPGIDTQHPCEVATLVDPDSGGKPLVAGRMLELLIWPVQTIESAMRRVVSFGEPLHEPAPLVCEGTNDDLPKSGNP